MTEEKWLLLAGQEVTVSAGCDEKVKLGNLLGCGGAGAVFDFCRWGTQEWVVKVLDPESPVAEQELKSLKRYRSGIRYEIALMKFHSWTGTLRHKDKIYPCYLMRKGRTLTGAIENHEPWLDDPHEVMRITATLVTGIISLKNAGISHGDIKTDNILLFEYQDTFHAMFSDYGTVSEEKLTVRTIPYQCDTSEYDSLLEERIAYDLHCLYLVLCRIYDVKNDVIPLHVDDRIFKLLQLMRNNNMKAFERLKKLMDHLPADRIKLPVSFHLDAVPRYKLTENFPFEKVMQWGEYCVLRDKNAIPGENFDPLLLMKIPPDRYDTVCKIIAAHNNIETFVMPIARYFDSDGGEYVLIHAPDDKRKCRHHRHTDIEDERLRDDSGTPYTLALAPDDMKKQQIAYFIRVISNLPMPVDVEISAPAIWHLDRHWKLNLFAVDLLQTGKSRDRVCIKWE